PPEPVDAHALVRDGVGGEEHQGIHDEDREEAEDERQAEPGRGDDPRGERGIAASVAGVIPLRPATTAATRSAATKPLMWAPGTIQAATSSPIAEKNHVRTMWSGLNRRRSSRHAVSDAGPAERSAVVGGTSSVGGTLIEWRLCAPGRLGVRAATRGGGSRVGVHSLSVALALDPVEPLAAARLHLRRLLLRVGVRVLDEPRAA